jgi:glycosyltransferase involved in cell wall biosynthesis
MKKKIRIIAYLSPSGSRFYRCEQIFKYLNRTGEFECVISPNTVTDEEVMWADIIFAQSLVSPENISTLWAYQIERGKKIVSDRDDVIVVEDHNPFKPTHDLTHAPTWTKQLLEISNLVTVTTEEIASEVKPLNKNTVVIPNGLDMELWDKLLIPNDSDIVRIGYTASITHRKDLEMIAPAIRQVLKENPKSKFIICGDLYLTKFFQDVNPAQIEFVDGTSNVYGWPDKVRSLSLDIAIAPVIDNHFNRGRSTLKFLENSMGGAAGVYSPCTYKGIVKHGKNGFLATTNDEWVTYLNTLIQDKKLRKEMAKKARKMVMRNYDMRKFIPLYAELFRKLV